MNKRLPYATLKNPTIEAILGDHFRFASKAQAVSRLEGMRESFQISKLPADAESKPDELKLWIRGYAMTAESRTAGYLGNFAQLRAVETESSKWTIEAAVLNIDKKFHPERRQVAQKFPNWGHPILRDIKKGRVYKTVDAAQTELSRLHETFPEVTIPLAGKCYVIVYRKVEEGASPVEKWVLEITSQNDEGFTISAKLNDHKPSEKAPTKPKPDEAAKMPQEAQGKFSAKVLLAKNKRKKPIKKPSDPRSNG